MFAKRKQASGGGQPTMGDLEVWRKNPKTCLLFG
jgi:hypothetical protein